MVEHPVANGSLVYATQFRIANPESAVWSVPICFLTKVAAQLKDVLFQMMLKVRHVHSVPLVAFENAPRGEQVLWRDY